MKYKFVKQKLHRLHKLYVSLSTLISFLLASSSHTNLFKKELCLYFDVISLTTSYCENLKFQNSDHFFFVFSSNETYVEADIASFAFNLNILAIQLMFKLYLM